MRLCWENSNFFTSNSTEISIEALLKDEFFLLKMMMIMMMFLSFPTTIDGLSWKKTKSQDIKFNLPFFFLKWWWWCYYKFPPQLIIIDSNTWRHIAGHDVKLVTFFYYFAHGLHDWGHIALVPPICLSLCLFTGFNLACNFCSVEGTVFIVRGREICLTGWVW